jgi:hypothetical protein
MHGTTPVRRVLTLRPDQPAPAFSLQWAGGSMTLAGLIAAQPLVLVFVGRDYFGINSTSVEP